MMSRKTSLQRKTNETEIRLEFALGSCSVKSQISTGIPFMDHILDAFARHGRFALELTCAGDLHVDAHHTMEDLGLALGQACKDALGDKRGITRFGAACIPLDEALARVVIDLSGRPHLGWRVQLPEWQAGGISARLYREFFQALVNTAGMTMHIDLLQGEENHHALEAIFKAFGKALRQAVDIDPSLENQIPSTKGSLD
jgi:imidazoleglycerol-phosphate dehydratase